MCTIKQLHTIKEGHKEVKHSIHSNLQAPQSYLTNPLFSKENYIPTLHYTILKMRDDEIIKKVYIYQKRNPLPGDWCNMISGDF